MAWTYNVATDIGKVRLELGDDVNAAGVRPDGSNFSDEEIQVYLSREGSVMGAVAGLCEALATQYAWVTTIAVGPRRENLSDVAAMYRTRARDLREIYGGAYGAYAVGVIRTDGYSDDVASNEVDAASEYGLEFEYVRPEV
jgi:hypothetical protein